MAILILEYSSHRVGARYTITLFGKSIRAGSLTPWSTPRNVPTEHMVLLSMYGQASVKSETHLPQREHATVPLLAAHWPQSTSPQLPHPSLLWQLLKSKSPSSESWRPKQKGNGDGAHPAQVRTGAQVAPLGQSASLVHVLPSVLHLLLPTGSHIPVQSASVWHVPPPPEQNPAATHFPLPRQSCIGSQIWPVRLPPWHSPESQVPPGHWQAEPSRVPPWHCPSVSAPHVPAQSALLRHVLPLLLPPWHALPTGDQSTAPPTRLSASDEQMPEQLYFMSPRSPESLASVPIFSGWLGRQTVPLGPLTVSYPGAQLHCPFEQ